MNVFKEILVKTRIEAHMQNIEVGRMEDEWQWKKLS